MKEKDLFWLSFCSLFSAWKTVGMTVTLVRRLTVFLFQIFLLFWFTITTSVSYRSFPVIITTSAGYTYRSHPVLVYNNS